MSRNGACSVPGLATAGTAMFFALTMCATPAIVRANGLDPTAERAVAAHRSAREAIRTLQARFQYEWVYPRAVMMEEGDYVRRNNDALIRTGKGADEEGTILIQNGEVRTVTRSRRPDRSISFAAGRMPSSAPLGLQDVWQRILLSHVGTDRQPLPFEQFVATSNGSIHTTSRTTNGKEVVTLSFAVGEGNARRDRTFELDAAVNFLVRKTTLSAANYNETTTVEVDEFREAKPGVFVPVRCRTRHHKGSELDGEWLFSLSDLRVNDPIPAERMTLPAIPSGTMLTDRMKDTRYPVDSAWNRIGGETPSPVLKVGSPADGATNYSAPSTDEPRSVMYYVVATALAVLAAAAAIWGARRWRGRAA